MDVREQLKLAALRVYAELGTRGATTKRIAQQAGVNEVTLFRHFGSKDALMREAMEHGFASLPTMTLPAQPVDPQEELTQWCRVHYEQLMMLRSSIRTAMGEHEEHPDRARVMCERPIKLSNELTAYLQRLRAAGLASGDWNARAAAAMLMGALFTDAMGRDVMPERFPYVPREGLRHYVSLFLRAIDARPRKRSGRHE